MILNTSASSLSVDQLMLNQTKREGTVLKLECEITGNPKPIYNWYKDDVLIASANQVRHDDYAHRLKLQDVPFGGKLRLEPILKDDAGWYKCVAENSNGVRETSAYVEVNPDTLFRERYLQKQQRERNNPSGASKNSASNSMSARIKSSANQKPSMPSSIIEESVGDVLSSLNGGTGHDSPPLPSSPFGLSSRLGDNIFFASPREDQAQPGELISASQMGHCEPYTGSICKNTLHGRPGAHVFVSSRTSQEQIERMLEAVISEINSQTGVISQDCSPYIAPMLCYHHLPPCADQHLPGGEQLSSNEQQVAMRFQRHSQSTTRYLPLEICQEDCIGVQTRHCRAEYAKMWSQQPYDQYKRQRSSMMLIGDRPLVPDCSILRRSDQPKVSDDYVGCVRLDADTAQDGSQDVTSQSRIVLLTASSNSVENNAATTDCYSGNGFTYQGTAKRTKSGKICASWAQTDYAQIVGENGHHNHCRNPAGDLPSPWCYTSPPFHRELCDIPKCSTRSGNEISTRLFMASPPPPNLSISLPALPHHHNPATQSTPLTFGSLPVFLPIIAIPVLFCLITLLLLCLCRNRIAKHCKRHRRSRHRSNSNGSGSKMTPAEQERSSSSAHYYAGFRSNASPGAGLFHQHTNNFLVYGGLPGQSLCSSNGSSGIHNNQIEPAFKHHQNIQMPTYPLAALRFFEQISDSTIARVFRGEITAAFCEDGLPSNVIVKMLRSADQTANSFNTEVEMLAGLQHPNIAHLVGVCFGPRPWCLLFECLASDSLRQFLVNSIRQPYTNDDQEMLYDEMAATSPFLQPSSNQLATLGTSSLEHSDLIYIAIQIAAALEHMTGAQQQLVHRELSSHTVHIGDHLLVKVLPFSACRSGSAIAAVLPSSVVLGVGSGPIASRGRLSSLSSSATNGPDSTHGSPAISPHTGRVAWLAPETILYGRQSAESDVWSFGIILWELFSYGCEPYSKASQMPGVDDRRIAELILGRSLLQRPTAASGLISESSADCPQFVYELMLECWDEIPSRRPTFADIHARLLQWRSEGLFKLRPISSAAVAHPGSQHLTISYDTTFPMPPLPRMCSTSQQSSSAGSSSSHQVPGDAASASTHHTITSVGSSDKSSGPQQRQSLLPPPVPPPHYNLPVDDFDNSYDNSDGGVYCGGSGNASKDITVDQANQAMLYESHGEEEENLLMTVPQHKNEALAHLQLSFGATEQQLPIMNRQQQQMMRRPSAATASPLLPPKHSLGSFSTTFGGAQSFYQDNNNSNGRNKRRLVVMSGESAAEPVATIGGRVLPTTAM